jgi:Tol biopolymer transport system component
LETPFPAYVGDDPYIFVSYSHEDSDVVYPELQWLKDQGFHIWYDEGISPGHEWRTELGNAIEGCNLFLYFVSPLSVASEHCQREVNYAMDQKKPLLVVHLVETELPTGLGMSLSSIQAIMRHELSDLDYRVKLVTCAGDHIQRGVGIAQVPVTPVVGVSPYLTVVMCLLALVLGGTFVGAVTWNVMTYEGPPPKPLRRFQIDPSPVVGVSRAQALAISSDGQQLYFWGHEAEPIWRIYRRDLGDLSESPVSGTERLGTVNGASLSISPDDQWLLFNTASGVYRVRSSGSTPVAVTTRASRQFTWGPDGTIVAAGSSGLMRYIGAGATKQLTKPEEGTQHGQPSQTPVGDAVVFGIYPSGVSVEVMNANSSIALANLATGEIKILMTGGSRPTLTESGHLLVMRGNSLWAAAYDAETRELHGEAIPIIDDLLATHGTVPYSVSREGTLIYLSAGTSELPTLVWVSRDGKVERLPAEPRRYLSARLSPDRDRIAVTIGDLLAGPVADVWIYTIDRETLTRLTFDAVTINALWTPDGRDVVYGNDKRGDYGIHSRSADGTGAVKRLTQAPNLQIPVDSDDGTIWFKDCGEALGCKPWDLIIGDEVIARPLWDTAADVYTQAISPDGRWIAYASDVSGRYEIYVRPYPQVDDGLWQVSTDGGGLPRWAPSGGELFYATQDFRMVAVPVESGETLTLGEARALFQLEPAAYTLANAFDVSADGDRFLMIKRQAVVDATFVAIPDFFDELERLAPHPK